MKKLRDELNELKKAKADAAPKPADNSGWGERIEALEIKSKDAVVLGDIGGGFRLPGSETSLRIYGYAEAHAIHDFKQSSSPDIFTDPTFQPLNNAGGLKGKTKFTAETSRFGFETSTPTSLGTFNTKVEADFYSYGSDNRNRLRLRHAYGEYGGWLIGQTWSTFMDQVWPKRSISTARSARRSRAARWFATPMGMRRRATNSASRPKTRKTSSAAAARTSACRSWWRASTRPSIGAR